MAKPASLVAALVAKKGEATPATSSLNTQENSGDKNYYKALTVKLDRERYERLKNIGVKIDKKSQEIFVEALDLWFESFTSHNSD